MEERVGAVEKELFRLGKLAKEAAAHIPTARIERGRARLIAVRWYFGLPEEGALNVPEKAIVDAFDSAEHSRKRSAASPPTAKAPTTRRAAAISPAKVPKRPRLSAVAQPPPAEGAHNVGGLFCDPPALVTVNAMD